MLDTKEKGTVVIGNIYFFSLISMGTEGPQLCVT